MQLDELSFMIPDSTGWYCASMLMDLNKWCSLCFYFSFTWIILLINTIHALVSWYLGYITLHFVSFFICQNNSLGIVLFDSVSVLLYVFPGATAVDNSLPNGFCILRDFSFIFFLDEKKFLKYFMVIWMFFSGGKLLFYPNTKVPLLRVKNTFKGFA